MSNWEVLNFYLENTILGETRTIQITLNLQRPVSLKPKGEFFPPRRKIVFHSGSYNALTLDGGPPSTGYYIISFRLM